MATNVKFLTGTKAETLPAYSAQTIGQVYFIIDTTSSDSKWWSGLLVYDSPQGRITMSSQALSAAYAEGLPDKTIADTFISNVSWIDENSGSQLRFSSPTQDIVDIDLSTRVLDLSKGGTVSGPVTFEQKINGIANQALSVIHNLNIADKSFNGSQEVNITKNEMISWLELDSSIIFVGVTTTPLSHGSHTTTIHKESANADITVTENTLAIYDGREYLFVNGSWQMLGVKIDKLVFTPEGSVNAHNFTPSGTLNMNDFTPSGTISTPTFTGTKVTWSDDVTPTGSISVGTGSANYTPSGTISADTIVVDGDIGSSFVGTESTISHTVTGGTANVSGDFTPSGNISSTTTIPSGKTSNYTPEGTISNITFTGSSSTVSVSGTATGTNANSAIVISPTTTTVKSNKTTGSVTAGTKASFTQGSDTFTAGTLPSYTQGSFSKGTLPTLTMKVEDETLTYTWSQGTLPSHGTDTFDKGTASTFTQGTDSFTANTPTSVSLPTFENITVWNGYNSGVSNSYAEGQVFTGTAFTSTGSTIAKGSVSTPTFSGKATYLSFTGAQGTISASGNITGINVAAHKFTPSGTVSSTFTGKNQTLKASFTGTPVNLLFTGASRTLSRTYTPTGTISNPIFTGTAGNINGTFVGNNVVLNHIFTGKEISIKLN